MLPLFNDLQPFLKYWVGVRVSVRGRACLRLHAGVGTCVYVCCLAWWINSHRMMNMLLWFWFFFLMNNVMHSPFSAVICSSFATKVDCWNTCLYCTWSSTEKRIWWQGTSSITFLIYLERCVFGSWVYLHDSALKFHKHAVLMALLLLMFLLCMCAVRPCLVVRSFHLWFVISSGNCPVRASLVWRGLDPPEPPWGGD